MGEDIKKQANPHRADGLKIMSQNIHTTNSRLLVAYIHHQFSDGISLSKVCPLRIHRRQLRLGRTDQGSFCHLLRSRPCIKSIKNRRTNKDGEEKGDYIHADAEK